MLPEVTKIAGMLPDPETRGGLKGIECKFVHYIPEDKTIGRPDMHYIKEVYHYNDGSSVRNLKAVKDYKRSFWITKEHKRNHTQKKETEDLENLNVYKCTQSGLGAAIASRLGSKYAGVTNIRDVIDSPFVYGADTTAADEIMYQYTKKYPNISPSPNIECAFDLEVNTYTDEVIVATVTMEDYIYTTILSSFLPYTKGIEEVLHKLAIKYFPDNDASKLNIEYKVCATEVDVIKEAFKKVHEWQPDFLAIHNISYDINKVIIERLNKHGVDPAEIFSDPRLDSVYKYYKWIPGSTKKVTESGVIKPTAPHEQWHLLITPASFFPICSMATFNFVRSGQAQIPGGYSLDNLLTEILGKKFKKLTFKDEKSTHLVGLEWHRYMTTNRPLEYIIYNQWDSRSMLLLDQEIKDISIKIRALSGIADYRIFNSGPKKIIANMHFFNLERGRVLGTKPSKVDDNKLMGLGNWIVMLEIDQVHQGLSMVKGSSDIITMIRKYVYDSDAISSYPSNILAANVSKDTTSREILSIEGISQDRFKINNINLMFGKVNHVNYMVEMCKFPSLEQLDKMITL